MNTITSFIARLDSAAHWLTSTTTPDSLKLISSRSPMMPQPINTAKLFADNDLRFGFWLPAQADQRTSMLIHLRPRNMSFDRNNKIQEGLDHIFLANTPSNPQDPVIFHGITPVVKPAKDFDYSQLRPDQYGNTFDDAWETYDHRFEVSLLKSALVLTWEKYGKWESPPYYDSRSGYSTAPKVHLGPNAIVKLRPHQTYFTSEKLKPMTDEELREFMLRDSARFLSHH